MTGAWGGGQSTEDIGFTEVYKLGHNRVHPLTIPKTMANAGASHISMEFGITGPSFTISTACSSAAHAIGQAYWMVRSGATDLALTGGSEAPFSFGILKAWEAMRVVSPETCRPFSKDRRGMILGEGAAMLVLEPLEAARARGARIHAELGGRGAPGRGWVCAGLAPPAISRSLRPGAPRAPCWRPCATPACRPKKSATSTRTAPPRWPTSQQRRRPSAPYSARTPAAWRSARRNRCTATRSA